MVLQSGLGQEFYLFFKMSTPTTGLKILPNQQEPSSFPEVMVPGRDVDHSRLPSAKLKNEWSYTSTPPTAWIARIHLFRLKVFLFQHSLTLLKLLKPSGNFTYHQV
jgi:hypothetical protein